MGKIIRTAKEYKVVSLLESANSAAVSDFLDAAVDAIDEAGFGSSYSILARNGARDPEKDYKKLLSALAEQGWSESNIKDLFSKYGQDIAKDYDNAYVNSALLCGVMDYFMYKMTDGAVTLMGYSTEDLDDDGSEYVVKFSYGYNRTPYGKLAMVQHCGSMDEFIDNTGERFIKQLGVYGGTALDEAPFVDTYSYDKSTKIGTINIAGVDAETVAELERALDAMGAPVSDGLGAPRKHTMRSGAEWITQDGGWSERVGDDIKIHFK